VLFGTKLNEDCLYIQIFSIAQNPSSPYLTLSSYVASHCTSHIQSHGKVHRTQMFTDRIIFYHLTLFCTHQNPAYLISPQARCQKASAHGNFELPHN